MENIRLARVGNIGDLQTAVLIDVNDVDSLRVPESYSVRFDADGGGGVLAANCLRLKPNAVPIDMYIKPGSGNFREIELADGSYEVAIKLDASGDWAVMGRLREWLRGRRLLCVLEDTNGTVRLCGTLKQPLRAMVSYDSSRRINGFGIGGVVPATAYYIDKIDEAAWRGCTAGFSAGFNFGFRS